MTEIEEWYELKEEIRCLKEENARLENLENRLLHCYYSNDDVLVGLYDAWLALPPCNLLAVIGNAIQTIQYYQAKEENCEEI